MWTNMTEQKSTSQFDIHRHQQKMFIYQPFRDEFSGIDSAQQHKLASTESYPTILCAIL